MTGRPGLRERKKQQTRLAISQVATAMFIERGFDRVTVAEVAEAAQVSVNTIFNYFSSKEDLFFDRAEEVEDAPSRMVRERRRGESALEALRRNFRQTMKEGDPLFRRNLRPFLATVEASPALKARARLLLERCEQRLTRTLVEETGARPDDPTPRVVAALFTALLSLLTQEYQIRLLRGEPDQEYRAALSRMGERGFELLKPGVGNYCRRPT